KCSRVMNAPAGAVGAGEELVQHLVEDDELDEVGGNLVPVERGMNPDLSGLVVVRSQADRPAALLERHAPPTDLGPDASLKVLVVEAAEDLAQGEAATVRVERRIRIPLLANQRLTTADEIVQDRSGFSLSASGVVGDRADHRLGRVEEHVVQAQSEVGLQPAKAHHRRAIVGDRKPHGDVQVPGESPRQVSRCEQRLIARRQRTGGLAPALLQIKERQLKRGCRTHGNFESYSRGAETQEAAVPASSGGLLYRPAGLARTSKICKPPRPRNGWRVLHLLSIALLPRPSC